MNEEPDVMKDEWSEKGPFYEQRNRQQLLAVNPKTKSTQSIFEEVLVESINVAYANGYLPGDYLEQMADSVRTSYQIWEDGHSEGSIWADSVFPSAVESNAKPGLKLTTAFVATPNHTMLLAIDSGSTVWFSPSKQMRGGRDWEDFIKEPAVIIEFAVDLFVMILTALNMPAKADKLAEKFALYLMRHPRLRRLLQRMFRKVASGSTSFIELTDDIIELFRLMWGLGLLSDLFVSLFEGFDAWDALLLLLSIISMLNPGTGAAATGAKIIQILLKFADMLVEIARKWFRYQTGNPLMPGGDTTHEIPQ